MTPADVTVVVMMASFALYAYTVHRREQYRDGTIARLRAHNEALTHLVLALKDANAEKDAVVRTVLTMEPVRDTRPTQIGAALRLH